MPAAARIAILALLLCAYPLRQITTAAEPSSTNAPQAGVPLLGFTTDAFGTTLNPIAGSIRAPRIEQRIPLPVGAARVYLPPQQRYALLENPETNGIAVWNLRGVPSSPGVLIPIPGLSFYPSAVIFSSTGSAVALVFADSGEADV